MYKLQPIKQDLNIEGFNSIYYFEFSKNFSHAPEKHDFWEMVYVDSGSINAITNGIGCTLSQGQAIFHEPMEMHAHISDNCADAFSQEQDLHYRQNFQNTSFSLP